MKMLCKAATTHAGNKEYRHLSFKAVDDALSQVMDEFNVFEEHRLHLSHLCSKLSDTVQGKVDKNNDLANLSAFSVHVSL